MITVPLGTRVRTARSAATSSRNVPYPSRSFTAPKWPSASSASASSASSDSGSRIPDTQSIAVVRTDRPDSAAEQLDERNALGDGERVPARRIESGERHRDDAADAAQAGMKGGARVDGRRAEGS